MRALFVAEAEGFEPPVPCGTPVFKTGAIDQLCQTSLRIKFTSFTSKWFSFFTLINSVLKLKDLKSVLLNDNKYYVKLYRNKTEIMDSSPVRRSSLNYLSKPLIFSIKSSCPVRA